MILRKYFDETITCNPTGAVMRDFSMRTGQAVDDLMLDDVQSLYSDIVGVVDREFDWADRITDRMGE